MSLHDNAIINASRDNDGGFQQLSGHVSGDGDSYGKSPYANAQMVSLHVGPKATQFSIHDNILGQSEVLAALYGGVRATKGIGRQSVSLPELDETTAHTLVHYLYTGTYQTLKTDANSDKIVPQSYMLGTCAYCAAARYKLPGLIELAKEKITSLGEDVSIFEVLSVARDHAFSALPEDDTWYSAYVEGALNAAMAEDPEPFRKPDFITQVEGNSKLLQVVWKTVMNNYAQTPTKPTPKVDEVATPTAETKHEVSESNGKGEAKYKSGTGNQNLSHGESDTTNEAAAMSHNTKGIMESSTDDLAADSETTQEDSLELEDIEPTVKSPAAPEPFTDELNYGSSKTYQQMGKKTGQPTATGAPAKEMKKPVHARADSVVQFEEPNSKACEQADVVRDGEQLPQEVSDVAVPAKKSKKQKKKKSAILF